jgi:hypothetical protein
MIDMGIKLKSVKDSWDKQEMTAAGSGKVGPAGGGGDEVTFREVGLKILRLLIDDEEEPGRPRKPARERRGRKNKDTGISFSFEVTAKITEEKPAANKPAGGKPSKNEKMVALAEPFIARIGVKREGREMTEFEQTPPDDDDTPEEETAGEETVEDTSAAAPVEDLDAADVIGKTYSKPVWRAPGEGEDGTGEADELGPLPEEEPVDEEEEPDDEAAWPAVGEVLELLVTEWGAVLHTSPKSWTDCVNSFRVPDELKAQVGWQLSIEGGDYADLVDAGGTKLVGVRVPFTVKEEHHKKLLTFRALLPADIDWKTIAPKGKDDGATGQS